MAKSFLALGLMAAFSAFATPASATLITFQGISQTVYNPDTGDAEHYTITFNFDSTVAPIISNETTFQGPPVNYQRGIYFNLLSATISGPRYTMTLTNNGISSVSTLATDRFRDGNSGFFANIGTEGIEETGFAMQMTYFAQGGFTSTAFPTSLDIVSAFENGFTLTEYFLNDDDPDYIFIDQRTALNFRFESGGIVPNAAAVPEPATWGMMIAGFGLVGGAMRYRRRRTAVAFA